MNIPAIQTSTPNTDHLLNRGLPKWPQMIVTGASVTIDQAKEIIFATDDFFTDECEYSGGNAREFNKRYREEAGLEAFRIFFGPRWADLYQAKERLRAHLKCISTEYVSNNWASSSFIFGPHGWCSPSGRIFYSDNIGKYPSVGEVLAEWEKIADRFTFLDLNITLMDGEGCEEDTNPVVNIKVKGGYATLQEPDLDIHDECIQERDTTAALKHIFNADAYSSHEIGLPMDWYNEAAHIVKNAIAELNLYDVQPKLEHGILIDQ